MTRLVLNLILGAGLLILASFVGALAYTRFAPEFLLRQEVSKIVQDAESRLQVAIAKADRLDPGWRLDEIFERRDRECPPDESNSALQVERVLALLPMGWGRTKPGSNDRTHDPDEIPRGIRLSTLLGGMDPERELAEEVATGLKAELDEVAEAVNAARRLLDFPDGQTSIVSAEDPLATLLTYTQSTRQVAQLLRLDAMRCAHNGDPDGALESVGALINTARSTGDEPFLVSQLVRSANVALGVSSLERVLAQGVPTDVALARMTENLLREARFPRFLIGLRGERAMMVDLCSKLDQGKLSLSDVSFGGGSSARDGERVTHPSIHRHTEALYLDRMTDAVEIAKKPLHEQDRYWAGYGDRIDDLMRTEPERVANAEYASFSPAISPSFDSAQRITAKLNAAAAAVACERFRQRMGEWPVSLDRLVPDFLDEIPPDPYTGEPVRICLRYDGLTSYAAGSDRHDDGGRLHPRDLATVSGFDVGFRLFNPEHRAIPPEPPPASAP